jgi:hypothetical protein
MLYSSKIGWVNFRLANMNMVYMIYVAISSLKMIMAGAIFQTPATTDCLSHQAEAVRFHFLLGAFRDEGAHALVDDTHGIPDLHFPFEQAGHASRAEDRVLARLERLGFGIAAHATHGVSVIKDGEFVVRSVLVLFLVVEYLDAVVLPVHVTPFGVNGAQDSAVGAFLEPLAGEHFFYG